MENINQTEAERFFQRCFQVLTEFSPMPWQRRLILSFEALLAEIAGNAVHYRAKYDELAALVPKFYLLPFSATGRKQMNTPFVLDRERLQ